MKAYIINLKRSAKRREHIVAEADKTGLEYSIVDAVDGALLSDDELDELCDMDVVRKYPEWLSRGMIGCVLSHKRAYLEFLETDDTAAMIIEDDAVLPANLRSIAERAAERLKPDTVQLFFYSCFDPLKLSTANGIDRGDGQSLLYPMTLEGVTGGVCYVIGREAARAMVEDNVPISLASDCWEHFQTRGYIKRVQCVYPMSVDHLGVKSVISATVQTGARAWLTNLVDKYEVPLIYRALQRKRQANVSVRLKFMLTDEKSPFDQDATSIP